MSVKNQVLLKKSIVIDFSRFFGLLPTLCIFTSFLDKYLALLQINQSEISIDKDILFLSGTFYLEKKSIVFLSIFFPVSLDVD